MDDFEDEQRVEVARLRALLDYGTDTDAYRRLRAQNDSLRAELTAATAVIERLEAAASQDAEEIARLRAPYRNADENDWRLLNEMVGNGGPANFWRAVLKEARAAIACRPQGEKS